MATRTTVCPGCDEAVPGGHLSCPSCGYMLAEARETGDTASAMAAGLPPAGAYIPPGAASSSASLMPARAWAGINAPTSRPMATLGLAHAMAGSSSPGQRTISTEHAQAFAGTIPAQAHRTSGPVSGQTQGEVGTPSNDVASWMETAAGWLMVVGAAVAILGFLLPWSRTVIGAEGVGTYFDTWGIANPSHALVVLGLAAALALAVMANRIPTWIRTCGVGLLLGGLLIGLTWPYLFGPLGAGPGVIAILVGGVLLSGAGILDLVEARHAPAAVHV